MSSEIKRATQVCYAALALPVAFAGFPLYVLAPDFYATRYGISLTDLGLALLGLRLFDAFQDPLIGWCGDRYRRYMAYIMVSSAVLLCLGIYGLFTRPYLSPMLWFMVCMAIAVSAYSVLSINLNSLGALWSKDTYQQTRIAGTREILSLFGVVFAVTLPGLLGNWLPLEQVYPSFTLILSVCMVLALFLFLFWYRRQSCSISHPINALSFVGLFRWSLSVKKLLLIYMISMLASAIPAVLVLFFVRDRLNAEVYTGLFLVCYFLSGACFMPFWERLSRVYGKYRTWVYAMLLAILSFLWAFTLSEGDIWQYALICLVSGIALGADLVFPPAILAQQLHMENTTDLSSTHYALLAFTAKVSLAFASAGALPILESTGFMPDAVNSASALLGLSLVYALLPCLLKCVAAGLLWYLFIHNRKGIDYETH